MFGTMSTVHEHTPLVAEADQARIEATIDQQMAKCTQEQAARLVAQLLAGAQTQSQNRTHEEERDFKLYVVKLAQAFMEIPFIVGEQAVHGGTGIPSKVPFKPMPSDVIAFAKTQVERLQNVKAMMTLHARERKRRADEKAREANYIKDPARQARIAEEIRKIHDRRNVDGFAVAQGLKDGRI